MSSINSMLFTKILKLFFDENTYLQIVDRSENNNNNNIPKGIVDDTVQQYIKNYFSEDRDVFINLMEEKNLMEKLTYCYENNLDACVLMKNNSDKMILRFQSKNFINKELFLKKIYQAAIMFIVLKKNTNKVLLPGSLSKINIYNDSETVLLYQLKANRKEYENTLTLF